MIPSLQKAIIELLKTTKLSHADIARRLHCREDQVRKIWLDNGEDNIRPIATPITLPSLTRPDSVGVTTIRSVIEAYFSWPDDMPTDLAERLGLDADLVVRVCRQERLPFRGFLYEEDRHDPT
jgi:hypothetical protein